MSATVLITIEKGGYEVIVAGDDGETIAMECRDFRGPEDPVKVATAVGEYARMVCLAMNADPEWRYPYAQKHVDAHVYKAPLQMSRSMCGKGVDYKHTRELDAGSKKRLNPVMRCEECRKLLDDYLGGEA